MLLSLDIIIPTDLFAMNDNGLSYLSRVANGFENGKRTDTNTNSFFVSFDRNGSNTNIQKIIKWKHLNTGATSKR